MARPLRIEYPGAYYHVINRGNNQEKIFKNKAREVAIFIARDMTGITCNDGVRLNIRPFMTVGDVKKRGAGVLRDNPNIKLSKDRGKDVESAPWYHLFKGYRINDHHLTIEEKRTAIKQVD
jgi:hypothetical protein